MAFYGLNIFEKNSFLRVLPNIVLFTGVIMYAFPKKGHLFIGKHTRNIDVFLYVALVLILLFSILRTNAIFATPMGIANESATLILINIFTYLACTYCFRNESDVLKASSKFTGAVVFGPTVLIFFMLMLFLLAYKSGTIIEGESRGKAVLLGLIGIVAEKRNIPLINVHPNYVGVFTGATFVMTTLAIKYMAIPTKYRKLLYINMVICFMYLVIADSRVTIISSLGTVLIIYILDKLKSLNLAKILVLLMPVMPLLLLLTLTLLSNFELVRSMSRNAEDLTTGNSRSYIWVHCYNEILHPKLKHLIGFGQYGHMGSGVSDKYAYIFQYGMENAETTVTHNTFLQCFLDAGYIGSFIFLAVLFMAMSRAVKMYKEGLKVGIVLLGFYTYFTISGTTESNFGNYNYVYFLMFMTVTMTSVVIFSNHSYHHRNNKNPNPI
jgi:O-antigen ligase